ncbi:MAG: hypothetical protein AAF289_08500 [Cyanobacteria bacterium P01_A01_bin.135]
MTPQAALLKASIDADIRELGVLIDIIRVLDLTGRAKSFGLEVLSCIIRVLGSVDRVLDLMGRAKSFGLEVLNCNSQALNSAVEGLGCNRHALSCNSRVPSVTVEDWSVTAAADSLGREVFGRSIPGAM